ncbi:lasso peptide biosynthesis B2 protein [Brevundimonas sp. PAMC22021]|uniref:lasso peptide biosynthesis B2 protein n=1 Tax=Brevundimonas sp. PAMC22021 TaxID=2861285 RepID=UPI001C62CA39|nr:lasso peptide biosynthesis B2 protein [Brevundimonas sp. PAMC22021]QYF87060.1 lasso peptide biosynthesis B2 protein [Brevundimonas sp. PAMC22021]
MSLFIADGVFMTACDADVVVLDTRSDTYSCLPEAAGVLDLTLNSVEGRPELLEDLAAAGLLTSMVQPSRQPLPAPPAQALAFDAARPGLRDEIAVVQGMMGAWRHGPGRRSLSDLLAPQPSPAPKAADPASVARLTSAFVRRLPWDPAQGSCLYRAWLLRRILQSRGEEAAWVFGVRTWPFGAHCWLQIGEFALDDDPDRIAQYTPIMAV